MNIKKLPIATATLLGALVVGSSARADLVILASIDGGATFTTVASDPLGQAATVASFTLGSFTLSIPAAVSDTPGTGILSELLSTTVKLTNTGTTAGMLTLLISATGFTDPLTPPAVALISNIGTTTAVAGANTLSYMSCVNTANGHACPSTFDTPAVSPDIADVGNDSKGSSLLIASLLANFSLNEELNISLTGGAVMNFSASTILAPTPLPAALPLFATGLGALGLFGWRRKRKNAVAA